MLGLILTKKEGLAGDMKVGANVRCSNHEMMEFRILCGRSKAACRTANPDLFQDVRGGVPWAERWKERRPEGAAQPSNTTSSKLRIGAQLRVKNWGKLAEGLHG